MKINERWIDRPTDGGTADDRIGSLLRQLPPAAPLPPDALMRVKARLRRRTGSARGRWLRWATVAALLILGNTGLVFATREVMRWFAARRAPTLPVPAVPPPVRKHASAQAPVAAGPAPVEPAATIEIPAVEKLWRHARAVRQPAVETAPAPAPIPSPPVVQAPAETAALLPAVAAPPARASAPTQPMLATPAPTPASGSLAAEAEVLTRALQQLRQEGRPAEALATLESYAERFPGGGLRREAAVARVDALLALGRKEQALAVLEGLPLEEVGRADELRVIRGELKAARDCQGATADFDRALAGRSPASLQERALHGRAACRARLGDAAGSQADLREYLRRFPDGRFTDDVRRKLVPSPTP